MTKGIKIEDVVLGGGDEALPGKTVVAGVRVLLNDGTPLPDTILGGPKVKINLGKRECFRMGRHSAMSAVLVSGRSRMTASLSAKRSAAAKSSVARPTATPLDAPIPRATGSAAPANRETASREIQPRNVPLPNHVHRTHPVCPCLCLSVPSI